MGGLGRDNVLADRAADGVAGGEHQAGPGEGAAVARPVARRVAGGATRFGEGVGTGADRGSGDGRVTGGTRDRVRPGRAEGPVGRRGGPAAGVVDDLGQGQVGGLGGLNVLVIEQLTVSPAASTRLAPVRLPVGAESPGV